MLSAKNDQPRAAGRVLPFLHGFVVPLLTLGFFTAPTLLQGQPSLRAQLKALPYKIVYECYVNNNWELYEMNADGSDAVNITRTPNHNEQYPQVSRDGTKIAFVDDQGEGEKAVRSLWVMDINGKHRKKLVEYARQPFWTPDGREIGYLPQQYHKFNVMDFYTKGMDFYNLATGQITPHPNSANLWHLYNPNFSPNDQWIIATVHAGMGFGHTILLIAAHGDRILNLKIPGCRPCLSPDGQSVSWGTGDHEIAVAPIDTTAPTPVVGPYRLRIRDAKNKIYHVDWSPDGRYLCFSRGPDSEGDLSKPHTFQAAAEIVGVYAKDWNLCVVSAQRTGVIDLENPADAGDFVMVTTNGNSNKEPTWYLPPGRKAH